MQRKRLLHDAAQLGLGPGARAPEEEAQAAELLLELFVPRHQQEAEHVIGGLLWHQCRRHRRRHGREGVRAVASLAPPWDVENHVVI